MNAVRLRISNSIVTFEMSALHQKMVWLSGYIDEISLELALTL